MKKVWAALLFLVAIPSLSKGSINAADIIVKQDSLNPMQFTVTVKYLWGNVNIPDSIPVNWGDELYNFIYKTDSVNVSFGLSTITYKGVHTYSNTYADSLIQISNSYPNRKADIININSSVNQPLYVEAMVNLHAQHTISNNSSPVLLASPFVLETGHSLFYNPEIFDTDNDSMTATLILPLISKDHAASGYFTPDNFGKTIFKIDNSSGSITWDSIYFDGYFDITYKVSEYRNGELLGSVMRDMLIETSVLNGIDDITSLNNREFIYPNPANNTLLINSGKELINQIEVKDILGRTIITKYSPIYFAKANIDIGSLPAGTYFATLQNKDGSIVVKKFVKE